MKMTIELEATARISVDINSEIIKDIMQKYNGDFERWAKNNYSDFIGYNDFEVDFDGCDYNEEEAIQLIKDSKEELECDDDFNIEREVQHMTALRNSECDTQIIEELEVFEVDVEMLSKAKNYVAFNNPKFELNYIYLDKNNISATDTHKLIHITNHKYSYDNVLFPAFFLEPMKKGGECFVNNNGTLFLMYENRWFMGHDTMSRWNSEVKFTDVKRILLLEDEYEHKLKYSFERFTSNSITQKYTAKTNPKDLIKFEIEEQNSFIKEIHYNEVLELSSDLNDVYLQEGTVHFIGDNMQVVVMGVFL